MSIDFFLENKSKILSWALGVAKDSPEMNAQLTNAVARQKSDRFGCRRASEAMDSLQKSAQWQADQWPIKAVLVYLMVATWITVVVPELALGGDQPAGLCGEEALEAQHGGAVLGHERGSLEW